MKGRRLTDEEGEDTPESEASTNDDLVEVFPLTGANELCQLVADDKIACGGGVVGTEGDGFGILLNKDLLSGSSSPCLTYGNPQLCSDGMRFEVANLEVWALTPHLFASDAEKSEKMLQFVKDNSRETPSSIGQWSHFI
mmetsp:Transcript_27328/g.74769  ORF Transcript_27328/g.74769 Transcript_27328/m.74769 type:complete len:139 (-) Transcript_27328:564-980(-)